MIAAALALALFGLLGPLSPAMNALLAIAAPVISGLFLALTLALLIADLKRPDRALSIVLKSNPTSWLVWGAYILGIFGLLAGIWFIAGLFSATGVLLWLLIPTTLLALNAGSAVTTCFTIVFLCALLAHVLLVMAEVFGPHANRHVALAARYISHGGLKEAFWGQFFAIGSLIPIVMLCIALFAPAAQPALLVFAGIFALAGLFVYERCFVVAGQIVPLS